MGFVPMFRRTCRCAKMVLLALEETPRATDAWFVRFVATFFLAALLLAPAGLAAPSSRALEVALVRQVNGVRAERGLRPLTTSAKLTASAAQHTREMGENGYFAHESLDSSPFWKRIERWYPDSGRSFWAVGENLLWSPGDITASDAVSMWMDSRPHRANLMSRTWREIGVSAIHFDSAPGDFGGRAVTVVTADFGARR
jgi:uncharacterized protein YkwD